MFGSIGNCTSTLRSGESCTPSCNEGWTSHGNRECFAGQVRSTHQCDANPCKASAEVPNGSLGNCTANLSSGAFCIPSCNEGWLPFGRRFCYAGNVADGFLCVPAPCNASSMPRHGESLGNCSQRLESGTTCVPTCVDGWSGIGRRECLRGVVTDSFTCVPDPCDAGETPLHGRIGNCSRSLASGSICKPICDYG